MKTIHINLFLVLMVTSAIWGASLPGFTVPGLGYIYLYRIIVLLLAVLVLLNYRKIRVNKKIFTTFCIISICFLLHALSSFFFSPDPNQALLKVFNYFINLLFIIVFMVFVNNYVSLKYVFKVITFNYIILLCIGLYEILTGHYLFYKGVVFSNRLNSLSLNYPLGPMNNTNDFVLLLLLLLPITIYYFNNKFKVFNIIINLCFLFIILNSESRITLFSWLLIFIVYSIYNKNKTIFIPLLIIALIGVIFFTYNYIPTDILNQYYKGNIDFGFSEGSGETRLNLIKNGFIILINSAFLGIGAGNINYFMLNNSNLIFVNGGSIHNLFLEILVEFGLPLFVVFIFGLIMIYKSFNALSRINNKRTSLFRVLIKTTILLLPLLGTVSSSLTTLPFFWLYFGLIIVIPYCLKVKYKELW